MNKRIKTDITINQMAELMEVKTPEAVFDPSVCNYDELWQEVYKDVARDEDSTAEHAEELADEAVARQSAEDWTKYCDAIVSAFEKLLLVHDLELVITKTKVLKNKQLVDFDTKYEIKPANVFRYEKKTQKTWRDAADKIRETINGVGYFYFSTLREFLDSGPYSPKQCVMAHLHYLKSYSEVYGDISPQYMIEKSLR